MACHCGMNFTVNFDPKGLEQHTLEKQRESWPITRYSHVTAADVDTDPAMHLCPLSLPHAALSHKCAAV